MRHRSERQAANVEPVSFHRINSIAIIASAHILVPMEFSGGTGRISAGKELPMSAREQSLKERCARFTTVISRLELQALTKRQRQVAELRIAGLSLQEIGKRLGISAERVRQIEARLRSRAKIALSN